MNSRQKHFSTQHITPAQFLTAVFDGNDRGEVIYTINTNGQWINRYADDDTEDIPESAAATYYCVSTVKHNARYPRRSQSDVLDAWVVVCDDVGTKAKPPPLKPSYIIETSAGNFQYGYFINGHPVDTFTGFCEYDAVLYSLAKAGYNDPGCRSASRVVRLPGSLHSSGFVARIVAWNPELFMDLGELLPAMGVEKVYPASSGGSVNTPAGKYDRLEDVEDSVYHWLLENGYVVGGNDQWVHIRCPWQAGHTDGQQGVGDTSYSPENYGTMPPAFHCFHGHCASRTRQDFRKWLTEQGCRVTWGEVDIVKIGVALAQVRGKTNVEK